jgi:hypothetical protein
MRTINPIFFIQTCNIFVNCSNTVRTTILILQKQHIFTHKESEGCMIGTIQRSHTDIRRCGARETNISDTVAEAEKRFRLTGWSKKKQGWTCPSCALAARNSKSGKKAGDGRPSDSETWDVLCEQ